MSNAKQISPPLSIGKIDGIEYIAISVEPSPNRNVFTDNLIKITPVGQKNPDRVVDFDSFLKMSQITSLDLNNVNMDKLRKMKI